MYCHDIFKKYTETYRVQIQLFKFLYVLHMYIYIYIYIYIKNLQHKTNYRIKMLYIQKQ